MNYISEQLRPLAVRVESIELDSGNARRHPDKNMKAIRASLKKFGQRKPIVVQKKSDGRLICRCGNGTLIQTKHMKRDYIAAVIIEEDDDNAKAFAIADNRSGELSEWDDYALSDGLRELADLGMDTEALGFTDKELEKLMSNVSGSIEDNLEKKKTIVNENPEFLIVIACDNEQEQAELYEEFNQRDINCKIM